MYMTLLPQSMSGISLSLTDHDAGATLIVFNDRNSALSVLESLDKTQGDWMHHKGFWPSSTAPLQVIACLIPAEALSCPYLHAPAEIH